MKYIENIKDSTYEMLEEVQKELGFNTMDELLEKLGNQYIEQRQ